MQAYYIPQIPTMLSTSSTDDARIMHTSTQNAVPSKAN